MFRLEEFKKELAKVGQLDENNAFPPNPNYPTDLRQDLKKKFTTAVGGPLGAWVKDVFGPREVTQDQAENPRSPFSPAGPGGDRISTTKRPSGQAAVDREQVASAPAVNLPKQAPVPTQRPEPKQTFGQAFKAAREKAKAAGNAASGQFDWTDPKTGKTQKYQTNVKGEKYIPMKTQKPVSESLIDAFNKLQKSNSPNIFEAAKKLSAAQKKHLDKNKNNKIDAEDFRMLRKENLDVDFNEEEYSASDIFSEEELAHIASFMEAIAPTPDDYSGPKDGLSPRDLTDEVVAEGLGKGSGRGRPKGSKSGSKYGVGGEGATTPHMVDQIRYAEQRKIADSKGNYMLKHPITDETKAVPQKEANAFYMRYMNADKPSEKNEHLSKFLGKHFGDSRAAPAPAIHKMDPKERAKAIYPGVRGK